MSSKTILVVDDSPMVCKLVRMTLESLGYLVFTFTDLKMAFEKIGSGGVDLVLLDINMPETSGLSFCETLKKDERTKEVPVVFLSTEEEEKLAKYTEECGAEGYINKNKGVNELAESIKNVVEKFCHAADENDDPT